MRLPPHRYPGYYSLRQMLVESFFADRAAGAVVKIFAGAKPRVAVGEGRPKPQVGRT
jgi:hypothetical protein